MGKRGPLPTPTSVLKLRGSWRGKLRQDEPKPEEFTAKCPAWMCPLSKEVWARVTTQLCALGVIGQTDAGVVERYCVTYAKWREAEVFIADHGSIQHGQQGDSPHPFALLAVKYGDQLTRLETILGLSPAARANLAKKPEEAKKAKDRFFDGGERSA